MRFLPKKTFINVYYNYGIWIQLCADEWMNETAPQQWPVARWCQWTRQVLSL